MRSLINVYFQVSLFTFCKYPREAAQYQANEVLGQLGRLLAPWHFLQVAAAVVAVDHVDAGSDWGAGEVSQWRRGASGP